MSLILIDSRTRRIDAKGRLSIPPAFIEKLAKDQPGALVLMFLDDCLQVVGPDQWARIEEELTSLSYFDTRARKVQRLLAQRLQLCERDSQGRIRPSSALKELAGIDEEVLILGSFNRIELWCPERFQQVQEAEGPVEELLGELFGGRE